MSEPEQEGPDSRRLIGEALAGWLTPEQLDTLLTETLAITKSARGWCGNCKKAVQVEIPDAKAVVSATAELLNQAKGRPTEQRTETSIVVNREVFVVEDSDPDPVDIQGE